MRVARGKRRFLIPEVVQTSAMDCGPASLKCLLEGFGITVSYGRLREACQTDVDGTSIDTMEEVAVQLGLEAEQVMIPTDHVLLPAAHALPAIVVVRLPNGLTHFVVAWRSHGGLMQLMDPGTGRTWQPHQRFLDELYVHTMPVPAADWRDWAETDEFLAPLGQRLQQVGAARGQVTRLIDAATADAGWLHLGALDATVRMTTSLVRSGGLRRGAEAVGVLETFYKELTAPSGSAGPTEAVPSTYWSVLPAPADEEGETQLLLTGAVLVRALGVREDAPSLRARGAAAQSAAPHAAHAEALPPEEDTDVTPPLSPELVAALEEPPSRPGREILRFLRQDGLLAPLVLVLALAASAAGVVIEALLFRGLLDIGRDLKLVEQRAGAMAGLIVFVAAMALLELPITATVMRLGRHLETRLRRAFLEKIPRLADSYFHSRLTSDMAERSHSIQAVRTVADLGESLLRNTFSLLLTAAGLIWLDPAGWPLVAVVVVVTVGLPLLVQPILTERDLRVRSHYGALTRFYLDAMLGLVPLRTHSAELAVRREHESLLVEWVRASTGLLRAAVPVKALLSLTGMGLAGLLLFGYLDRAGERFDVLLYVFWALNLPSLGAALAGAAQQYPSLRNVTLRLLEPLGATEREAPADEAPFRAAANSEAGVRVELRGVGVRAAGHTILRDLQIDLAPGEHVAVVGPSGAGKSTLVGLLLGWHRPCGGELLVDGAALDEAHLEQLRRQTAWVDPAVQLWNRSLLYNLKYGTESGQHRSVAKAMDRANLRRLLESLPHGLQTSLGEGGALVSGGEGQRVRMGRALLRDDVRLVVLDEPFRGLDREQRRELLARARQWWSAATLICVTHDVGETRSFERVLVVDQGAVVEDDAPGALERREDSVYRQMLDAERQVREGLWSSAAWQRLWLEQGRVSLTGAPPDSAPDPASDGEQR